jgi:hypothetical protein
VKGKQTSKRTDNYLIEINRINVRVLGKHSLYEMIWVSRALHGVELWGVKKGW